MNATPSATARDPFSQWPSCFQAIFPAPVDRRDFLELKFGWLLAPTLDAPELVFRDEHAARAELGREDLRLARARYFALRKYRADRDAMRLAARQLRFAWRVLVRHAVGYTYPGAELHGGRVLFAFDVQP